MKRNSSSLWKNNWKSYWMGLVAHLNVLFTNSPFVLLCREFKPHTIKRRLATIHRSQVLLSACSPDLGRKTITVAPWFRILGLLHHADFYIKSYHESWCTCLLQAGKLQGVNSRWLKNWVSEYINRKMNGGIWKFESMLNLPCVDFYRGINFCSVYQSEFIEI